MDNSRMSAGAEASEPALVADATGAASVSAHLGDGQAQDIRKIVTNRCHGGFGLSHAGVLAYAMHKGLTLYPEHDGSDYGFWTYWLVPEDKRPEPQDDFHLWSMERRQQSNQEHDEASLTPREIARDDPSLVAVVEALGDEANGACAKLQVTEIPADVDWGIEEYDGLEWVAEKHRTW